MVHVLLKERAGSVSVLGVYDAYEGVRGRLLNIEKANPQYPLRPCGDRTWTMGPEEDEGFFGDKPVTLWVVEAKLHSEVSQ